MSPSPITDRSIFLEAIEIPSPDAREAFVARACGDDRRLRSAVDALLEAHRQSGDLLDAPDRVAPSTYQPAAERLGTQIGPYKLLQQIGEGGMGVVYMAEQLEPVKRRVALKIIKPGMDTRQVIARFEAERQALALMDHPSIAKVLDAGATESGRPFFVMELVRGIPITRYCDEHQLPIRERMKLLLPVCQAIQHAHQKGIIHRDIKPTNILVAEFDQQPVPKVIDFGVARATSRPLTDKTVFTGFGQIVGTLEYMSPEQARLDQLDIDTRSDIYSLGVLLYELLTGSTPFDKQRLRSAAFDEMLRIIREEEPPRPSTRLSTIDALPSVAAVRGAEPARLTKLVRGEIDWIVMKCLEKDRNRRYETANNLALDVQRYLADEPVSACPPSSWYLLRKFVRRNSRAVFAATLIATILLAGIVGTTIGLGRALVAERLANDRLTDVQRANSATKKALTETQKAKTAAEQSLKQEQRASYFQRIALAKLELENNKLDRAEQFLNECPSEYRQWEWQYLKRLCHGELLAFTGHEAPIWCVAASPDGRLLASGDGAGTVRLWDIASGKTVRVIRGHAEKVNVLAFSPDGTRLASGSGAIATNAPGEIHIWDVASGDRLRSLVGHRHAVSGLAFLSGGGRLIAAIWDGTWSIWDLKDGSVVATSPPLEVSTVASSSDGRFIAAGCHGGEIHILDGATASELRVLRGHTGQILGLNFGPHNKQLVSASWDTTVRIWEVETGRETHALRGHDNVVSEAAFSPDGRRIVSGSHDGVVKIWQAASGVELTTLHAHTGPAYGVAFTPGGCVVTGGWDRTVKLWDTGGATANRRFELPNGWISPFAYSGNGKYAAVGSFRPQKVEPLLPVQILDVQTGRTVRKFAERMCGFQALAFSHDGRLLAAEWNHKIKVWDADTGAERFTLTGHRAQVTALAISCDSCQLASVSEDGSLKIWDLETGKERATLADGLGMLTGVAFSPNGDLVVSAGKAGVVRVWDAASGKPLATLGQGSGAITAIAFGKRGEFAFASEDGNITLLHGATEPQSKPAVRIATGLTVSAHGPVPKENVLAPSAPQNSEHASLPPTAVLPQSLSCVRSLSFSPDGQRIAGSCDDGSIRIWDTLTGQVALSIPGVFRASSETSGVAFSPDGQWLACCCATPHAFKMWYAGPAMERAQALERWHALEADGLLACKGINAALAHLDVLPATERAQALQRWHALEADQLMARKEYKLALSHLDALIDELPQDADLYRRRVAAHRALGNNDAALEDYRRAIAILDERCAPSPENSAHILKLATCCCEFGNLLRNRRKPGEAVDCFTRAIDKLVPLMEVQPEVLGVRGTLTSCYWGRAYALADLGRTAEAIPDWDRTIESTSSSQWQWQVFRGRGTAHSALGNYREAVLDFAAAFQARPQDPHLWQQIVALHRVAGDREEVAAAFREAVRLNPKLGEILKAEVDAVAAIAELREASQRNPGDVRALVNLGIALHQRNDLKAAAEAFRKAIALDSEDASIHDWLGYVLMKQREFDSALKSFREAIRLNPKHVQAHTNLGSVLRQQGNPVEASTAYSKAIEIDAKYAFAYYGLGYCFLDQQKFAEASTNFRQAIEIDSKTARFHSALGVALHGKGDRDGAIEAYRKALELDPDFAEARVNLKAILEEKK